MLEVGYCNLRHVECQFLIGKVQHYEKENNRIRSHHSKCQFLIGKVQQEVDTMLKSENMCQFLIGKVQPYLMKEIVGCMIMQKCVSIPYR